ncbi:MAG: hypothetical protein CM1200mP3_16020 [Chloroflexota bacterium]|nr:MAG: hypothetical protein CM1200mP3_16020 [Chloroflexota bacterium]
MGTKRFRTLSQIHSLRLENPSIKESLVRQVVQASPSPYDKQGDFHYDTISAFIKSVRSSDPDSSLYYLARMLKSGEDPNVHSKKIGDIGIKRTLA